MIFREECLDGIQKGRITVAFRRWRRPSVKAGGTLLTAIGLLRKLKALGLTESLEVGYRLSPRGAALLGELRRRT